MALTLKRHSCPRRRWGRRRRRQQVHRAGTDLTLMSGPELFMREDVGLTDAEVEVLAGSMNVFMLASILAAGWVADQLGRRRTLVLANDFLMAGTLAMSLGASFAALMAARFVTSVGARFAPVVAPVYNAEISPVSTRGVLSSELDVCAFWIHSKFAFVVFNDEDVHRRDVQIFINVGILLSYVSNYAFAGAPQVANHVRDRRDPARVHRRRGALFIMPESPRWLAMRGRHGDARAVLLRPSDTPADADLRLEEIKRAVANAEAPPSATARHSGGDGVVGVITGGWSCQLKPEGEAGNAEFKWWRLEA